MTISPAQRAALASLRAILPTSFYLAGGVGLAARLGHRTSHDLDLFGASDPQAVVAELERLPGAVITGRARGTVHLTLNGVPVTLLEYRYPDIEPPGGVGDLPIPVASLDDLAGMKLSAIANRGAARDFWDLHSIVGATRLPLARWLEVFQQKYQATDIGHVVRSLVYFGDADAAPLPTGLSRSHWETVKRDFESWVRAFAAH